MPDNGTMTGLLVPLACAALIAASAAVFAGGLAAAAGPLLLAGWFLLLPGRGLAARLDHFLFLDGRLAAGGRPGLRPGASFWRARRRPLVLSAVPFLLALGLLLLPGRVWLELPLIPGPLRQWLASRSADGRGVPVAADPEARKTEILVAMKAAMHEPGQDQAPPGTAERPGSGAPLWLKPPWSDSLPWIRVPPPPLPR